MTAFDLRPAPDTAAVPATIPTTAALRICTCGHEPDAHEHYRAGTDCALCGPVGCSRYRQRTGRRALSAVCRTIRRRSTLDSPAIRRRH